MKEEEMWSVGAVTVKDVLENPVCEISAFDCLKNKES
jgi:hypothetical protein